MPLARRRGSVRRRRVRDSPSPYALLRSSGGRRAHPSFARRAPTRAWLSARSPPYGLDRNLRSRVRPTSAASTPLRRCRSCALRRQAIRTRSRRRLRKTPDDTVGGRHRDGGEEEDSQTPTSLISLKRRLTRVERRPIGAQRHEPPPRFVASAFLCRGFFDQCSSIA